jgi:peptide/nickel transport system permease protein
MSVPFSGNARYEIDLGHRFVPALSGGTGLQHPLGTDHLGRDVLTRLSQGLATSLLVAALATALSAAIGIPIGLIAVQFGRVTDDVLMMLADVQASLPFLVVALTVIGFAGPSLAVLIVLLALQGWHKFARLMRAEAAVALRSDYVLALRTIGASVARIYFHHVIPNAAGTLVAAASIIFAEVVLLESAISFLGLGIQPPAASLGSLVGAGAQYVLIDGSLAVIPAIAIVLIAASVATLGDWFRQRLDRRTASASVPLQLETS